MQGCTYSTDWLHFVFCLLWLQVLGQCMAVGTNSFPPSWTMYDCMYSMATFWTLCSCKYSGQGGIWAQVFIGHNLHDATCKYIDSRLLNGARTHLICQDTVTANTQNSKNQNEYNAQTRQRQITVHCMHWSGSCIEVAKNQTKLIKKLQKRPRQGR